MLFLPTARIPYAAAKTRSFDIDVKRLLALFRSKGRLVCALYYTALAEDQGYSSIRPLINWLDYNGYTMVTKPTQELVDATGRRKVKGRTPNERSPGAGGQVPNRKSTIVRISARLKPYDRPAPTLTAGPFGL